MIEDFITSNKYSRQFTSKQDFLSDMLVPEKQKYIYRGHSHLYLNIIAE